MLKIREAQKDDLEGVLRLYALLKRDSREITAKDAQYVWETIRSRPGQHVIVGREDGSVVCTCMIIIVPNLTHDLRPFAVIENMITSECHRGRGYATKVLAYAKEIAQRERCYKIMLMTGAKDEAVFGFYERAGYNRLDKTAFIQWLD
jgi:ribosomal protein S18 acetylase RimI-like enzyme